MSRREVKLHTCGMCEIERVVTGVLTAQVDIKMGSFTNETYDICNKCHSAINSFISSLRIKDGSIKIIEYKDEEGKDDE